LCLGFLCRLVLCRLTSQQYEPKPEALDTEFPQFSKFWFVFSKPREVTEKQSTNKVLEGDAEIKGIRSLDQARMFMEGMGFPEEGSSVGGEPQIVNVKYEELQKKVIELKTSYLIFVLLE